MHNNKKKTVGYLNLDPHNAGSGLDLVGVEDISPPLKQGLFSQLRGAYVIENLLNSRQRAFWVFQVGGWFGYFLLRCFHGMVLGYSLWSYAPLALVSTLIGFSLTIALRYLYRHVREMPLSVIVMVIFAASGLVGALFSTLETSIMPFLSLDSEPYQGLQKLGNAMFESTVVFAWSAIYFGYHYYEGFQDQREQTLRATAMAHQAQLQMLRYQLNPHFLFNTLNAISTLVLDKSEADANRMLTKLSSFLRYTLVNQPTQRVSLDQELHALSLYLDIEKVRFQDRLVVDYHINDNARVALVPNLILQPLIENVIKYAIAPSEEGGVITITADVIDGRLKIALKDTGPGMEDVENTVSKSGSGVGLVNTKERLFQIYGDDHLFKLENLEPTGLGVFIEIPCERKKKS